MQRKTPIAIATAAGAMMLLTACSESARTARESTTATPSRVKTAMDGAFVSVSGTVVESGPHSFELDYGPGFITVEMDDMDWDADSAALLEDDRVVVHGRVDDDFYEQRTIEAGSVYVKGLGTHFFASPIDEEQYALMVPDYEVDEPSVALTGTVEKVGDGEFVLDTGTIVVDVDTGLLPYDPLDDEGYQQIDAGDRVRVHGELEPRLFADHDLVATMVISLYSEGGESAP